MTELEGGRGETGGSAGRCPWCGRRVEISHGPQGGRPRLYCRRSCRQRMYEARRRSSDLGLTEHELVVTRAELDALTDQIWLVEQLTDDIVRAGPDEMEDREHRELLNDYLAAIQALLAQQQPTTQNAGNPRSVKLR